MSKQVFCIMGPTASGKTALAIELVQRYPFEIISVDSAMIYREMDVGTAKPSQEELQKAPHHLIDIIDPIESYSAARFCTDALDLCKSIFARNKIPLLVGGTMMYFNALQKGLSTLPEANEVIRQQIEAEALAEGWGALHQKLLSIDPQAGARIHAHDAQRIQRALEVYYTSGTTLSELINQQKNTSNYQFANFSLFPQQRDWLHERIAQRFDLMLEAGVIDEVKGLKTKWAINNSLPSMRCVGYRQILEFLEGKDDYSTMRDKGIAATRQLAKRQLTWLRHWDDVFVYDPQKKEFIAEIIKKMHSLLDF